VPRRTPAVAALALLLAALLPTASEAARPRADLKVTAGEVSASGARVTGWFTLHNKGTRRAGTTSTAVKVDGKRVRSVRTSSVGAGRTVQVRFSARVGGGTHVVSVCADRKDAVEERREGNNCRRLGSVTLASTSVPADPVDYERGGIVNIGSSPEEYWVRVPTSYDDSHQTPIRMVVFVHGCGGVAQTEAQWIDSYVANADDHLLMVPGLGRDGQCWDSGADAGPLLDSIADAKTHFNVDPRRVVVGGYSSGSTLAGQVAFANAELFAGVYALPGRPFWSNDNRNQLMKAAAWKLNVAYRPHTGDEYYPIGDLRADKRALQDAGFPVSFGEVGGNHAYQQHDFTYVFGKADGWVAP
jgi:hypothetical protein